MRKVEKIKLTCKQCGEAYLVHPYRVKVSKFCSPSCHGTFRIYQHPEAFFRDKHGENHPMFGKHLTAEWKSKISKNHADMSGNKNPGWKGENAKYGTKHDWVERLLGKPQRCDKCGSTEKQRYEWANRSREYKREISDWIRLCVFCHRKADYHQLPL